MKLHNYILEITTLMVGMVIMIFELVGSRILGPYLGTSIYVWAALIGIILTSLSLGNYLGGKVADRKSKLPILSTIILGASASIGFTTIASDFVLKLLGNYISDLRLNSTLSSIILFAPANIFLGMVLPFISKFKIKNLNNTGVTIGKLSALSSIGGILGTFLTSFFLIPSLGTKTLLFILAFILFINSILISAKYFLKLKCFTIILISLSLPTHKSIFKKLNPNILVATDTKYNKVWIRQNTENGNVIRTLLINGVKESAMSLAEDDLIYPYTEYYHLVSHFNPKFKKSLMIGGGVYSFPKDYLKKYPNKYIDVVEIDPSLTSLAKKYFKLEENPRLNIEHQDGRTYLNRTQKKYDAIFIDAFDYLSIPFQLTTKEAIERQHNILKKNGLVIVNLGASSIKDKTGKFLRAEFKTYKTVFPKVYLFPVKDPENGKTIQNIMLVALKTKRSTNFHSSDKKLNQFLSHFWENEISSDMPILSDGFAPVNHYLKKTVFSIR